MSEPPREQRNAPVPAHLPPTGAFAADNGAGTVNHPPGRPDPTGLTEPAPRPEVPGYEIEAELGRGGMGIVYKARQHALNRTVALKMVLSGATAKPEDLVRFLAEAETAAHVQHQGIVQIFESGRVGGLPYFTMEYVDGGSLADRLRGGPLPAASAARVALQLAEAVAHAHAGGVVHRDLKPSNILLAADGTPKVTDFGLARRLTVGDGLTRTGTVLGTPSYMPPEQARGDLRGAGPLADVYSLGAILYELLTGRPPFRAENPVTTLSLVLNAAPERPRSLNGSIPRDLETVALKCLEKEPGKRYVAAEALATDLRRFLEGRAILARRVGPAERLQRWAKRNPAVASLLTLVLVSLTAGAAVSAAFAVRAAANAARADANARELEQKAREADAARDAAQSQVVRLDLATARQHADRGEAGAALHWVTRAWQDDLARLRPGDRLAPTAEANHRLRVGNASGRLPLLTGFCPHDRPVLDADCDPTGDRVVSLVGDNVARVWDAGRAEPAYPPLEHGGRVTSAEFSVNGERMATGSEDGTARVWDAATGKPLHTFRADGPVARVSLSPDGSTLAVATGKAVLRWDTATGEPRGDPLAGGDDVIYVAFSPDGSRLVTQTAGEKGTARVWDAATGKPLSDPLPAPRYREGPRSEFAFLREFEDRRWPTFSPDGRSLAVADGFRLRLWSADGVKVFPTHQESEPKQIEACIPPAGQPVYFIRRPGGFLWTMDPTSGKITQLPGAGRWAIGQRLNPGGNLTAVTVSVGNTVLFRLPNWTVAGTLPAQHNVTQFRFTRDGRRIMIASMDGAVRVWGVPGVADVLPPYQFDCGRADRFVSNTRRLSPDAKWEGVRTPQGVRVGRVGAGAATLLPGTATATGFQFTPDGTCLVTTCADSLDAWSVGDGGVVRAGSLTDRRVARTAFSGDGRRVATLSRTASNPPKDDGVGDTVEVWELPGLRQLLGPVGRDLPRMVNVVLNRDGTLLLAAQHGSFGPPCWEVETGRRLPDIRLRGGDGDYPTFGERDDRIVTAMSTFEVYQWDVRAGRPAGPTIRQRGARAIYSPDQTKVLVVFGPGFHLFDARTGEALATLPGPATNNFWFSGDGRRIVIQSRPDDARVWTLPEYGAAPEHLPALARLLTGTMEDPDGGFISLETSEFLTNGPSYHRAFRAWRGLPAD